MMAKTKKKTAKPHETLTIDLALLRGLCACLSGLDRVAGLLPATISTDPEENVELACALVDCQAGRDVLWLFSTIATETGRCCDQCVGMFTDFDRAVLSCEDPYVLAQWLAATADFYLTRKQ